MDGKSRVGRDYALARAKASAGFFCDVNNHILMEKDPELASFMHVNLHNLL
jgi:hypothetical protein